MFLNKIRNILCPGHKICVRNKCCSRGQTRKQLCPQQCVLNCQGLYWFRAIGNPAPLRQPKTRVVQSRARYSVTLDIKSLNQTFSGVQYHFAFFYRHSHFHSLPLALQYTAGLVKIALTLHSKVFKTIFSFFFSLDENLRNQCRKTAQEKDYTKLLTKFLKGQSADRRHIPFKFFHT